MRNLIKNTSVKCPQLRDTSPSITLRQQWMNWMAAHKRSIQALLGDENGVEGWGRVNPVVRHSLLRTRPQNRTALLSPPRMCVTRVMECTSTANRQVTTDLLYSEISLKHYDFGINGMAEPDPQLQFYGFFNMPVLFNEQILLVACWSFRTRTRTFWFPFKHGSLTKQTKRKNKLFPKI